MSRTPTKGKKASASKARKAPLATREVAAASNRARSLEQDDEPVSQITLKLRQSQHRQLAQMAFDAGTTMRGIIMRALKTKGLTVTKEDLKDRRRR